MNTAPTRPGISSKLDLAVVPCTRVDPVLWTWLGISGEAYRKESGDASPNYFNLNRLREVWRTGGNHMMLWLLLEGQLAFGYAITEITYSHRRECYIPEGWIHPRFRRTGAFALGFSAFEAWARAHDCATIKFSTFRSARAYSRLLGGLGWRGAETVLEKPLER